LRKRLFEGIGGDVSLAVGNLNISNAIDQRADSITSEIGQSSIATMAKAFNSAVAQLAIGGQITNDRASFSSEKQVIENEYAIAIDEAQRAGKTAVADILMKEKEDLLAIADSLKESLVTLKDNYEEAVAKRKIDYAERLADINEAYTEDVADETESYDRDVADATTDYNRDKEDYNFASSRADEDYAKDLADQEEAYKEESAGVYSDLVDKRSSLRERAEEMNQLGKLYGTTYSNGRIYNSYGPEGAEAPDYSQMKMLASFNVGKRLSFEAQVDARDAALNKIEEVHGDYQRAIQDLIDVGVANPATLLPGRTGQPVGILQVMGSNFGISGDDFDLEAIGAYIADQARRDKEPDLKRGYDEDKANRDLDWSRTQEDYTIETSRRDEDHTTRLADYKEAYNKATAGATESYTEDVADYVKQYDEDQTSLKESAADSVTSRKAQTQTELDSAERALADTLEGLKDNMNIQLSRLKSDDSGTDVDTSIRASDVINTDARMARGMTLTDLLKKLGLRTLQFNTGGTVPFLPGSTPGKDSVMAALTPGEVVIQEPVVRWLGSGFFNQLNNFKIPQFNAGGVVGSIADSVQSAAESTVKHSLELTLNGNTHEPLFGSQAGINSILEDLAQAKMRS